MTQRLLLGVVGAIALAMVTATTAHARTSPTQIEYGHADDYRPRISSERVMTHHRVTKKRTKVIRVHRPAARYARPVRVASAATVIGGRPAGCPHRFCGCALSIKLFGAIKPSLNLAANWMRVFPRTAPAPGMVAARRGHVFQLVRHVSNDRWVVWDANSGGGRIHIHERRIARYVIVNPHASRLAAL